MFTCRPSGALVCLVHAAFYKHAAPLGLNAEANSLPRQRWSRWGGVSVFYPCRLLNPPNPRFRQMGHIASLGLNAAMNLWGFPHGIWLWCMPFSINMPPLWG